MVAGLRADNEMVAQLALVEPVRRGDRPSQRFLAILLVVGLVRVQAQFGRWRSRWHGGGQRGAQPSLHCAIAGWSGL